MNAYEEKQAARRERYEARAESTKQESNARHEQARRMGDAIPLGQPIMVGHHSEKRDRNYRGRIDNHMRKSVEADKKAEYYAEKAAAVGTGGISSDDPDAIEKLRVELAKRQADQEKMKQANKLVKKEDVAGLTALGYSETEAAELLKGDWCGRKGFASCTLTNNNASIKRIGQRIKTLEAKKKMNEREVVGAGYTYREDPLENRVMFFFDGKPPAEVRQVLSAHAFKFSPSRNNAWVRQLTNAGIYAGKQVREALDKLATEVS